MQANMKIIINKITNDLSEMLNTTVVVIDKNNKVLLSEGKNKLNIGDIFKTDCNFRASDLINENEVKLCMGGKDTKNIKFAEITRDLGGVLNKFSTSSKDINAIMLPLGSGIESLGAMIIFLNDELKRIEIKRVQYFMNMMQIISELLVDKQKQIMSSSIRTIEEVEKEMIIDALRRIGDSSHDINIASEKLGINRSTFYRKCKKYGIDIHNIL